VALSYHHWQTYAGSAPIFDHRPHLATHSLLGIGSASVALENLTRYLENIFDTAMIPQRIMHLQHVSASKDSLTQLSALEPFWEIDHLFDSNPPFQRNSIQENQNPYGPHLTYFSGPDGFRSTTHSLSAPLEAITGCNTPSWTLQTLTHEISHTVVRSVMGRLLPNITPPDYDEIKTIIRVMTEPESARDLLTQIKALLLFGLWRMNSQNAGQYLSPKELPECIRQNSREADEILTHIFDFLYHYRNEPDLYVKSIWASWATIPHIEDRIDEYVIRTLCSLHAPNLRRERAVEVTVEQTADCLNKVHKELPELAYIAQAINALHERRDHYVNSLAARTPLAKFGRYVLWSKKISEMFTGESEAALSDTHFKSLEFSEKRIHNPLRFVEECSKGKNPEPIKSVWILQHLAYGLES
jgi:hypothetical protein